MDYGNTKTPGIYRRLGSMTVAAGFPRGSIPNFPREKVHWDNSCLKKTKKTTTLYCKTKGRIESDQRMSLVKKKHKSTSFFSSTPSGVQKVRKCLWLIPKRAPRFSNMWRQNTHSNEESEIVAILGYEWRSVSIPNLLFILLLFNHQSTAEWIFD